MEIHTLLWLNYNCDINTEIIFPCNILINNSEEKLPEIRFRFLFVGLSFFLWEMS